MPYQRVVELIYRDTRTGKLYERPKVDGRWTWRRLNARTVRIAKEEVFARRQQQVRAVAGLARDPYAPASLTAGAVLERWQAAGCPTNRLAARTGEQLRQARCAIARLLPFWQHRPAESVTVPDCLRYKESRRPATRAADVEVGLLHVALSWAHRCGLLATLPDLRNLPRLHTTRHHHRDFMPASAEELHSLAAALFEHPVTAALGFQLLLEAFTGCRTSEILALRWDAGPQRAGAIQGGWLWLARAKGGVNPFALIHPALHGLLEALRAWRQQYRPGNPWFIPANHGPRPMRSGALTRALARLRPLSGGARRTSHALRGFYCTVRRSQGISDAQIAAEIGDVTGASIIAQTYGAVPPNWQAGAALDWLPAQGAPAWSVLDLPQNVIPLSAAAQ